MASTFKRSPEKRPWHQRLTPLAWALVGVVGILVVLGLVWAVMALSNRSPSGPWNPTPTATPAPTETAAPTAGPSPTPTPWYENMITPTVEATIEVTATEVVSAAHPAWWSDQMTQDDEGNWWPPEEVVEMVKEDYRTFREELTALTLANDLEGIVEALPRWYTGDSLEAYDIYYDDLVRAGDYDLSIMQWEDIHYEVQNWSEDGLECILGMTTRNGVSQTWVEGELVEGFRTNAGGLFLFRMRYDPTDDRWKDSALVDHYPVEENE